MTTISALENTLKELEGQTEASDASESFVAKLCSSNDIPVDRRVASLLRVMAIDSKLIYDSSHRKKSLDIILDRLKITAPSVLSKYKIDKKTQADEQCNKLANLEPDAMNRLKQSLDKYNGIDRVVDFRQQLLKGINNHEVKVALLPFLDLQAEPKTVLKGCLDKAVDYSKANPEDARVSFEGSQSELEDTLSRFNTSPSKPGKLILDLLQILYSDLKRHFEDSPYSKQAELTIIQNRRKYPFHIPDHELLLFIEIKNIGEGVALDVAINLADAIGLISLGTPSRVSDIQPGQMMLVEIMVKTDPDAMDRDYIAICEFDLSWVNTDGSNIDQKITIDLEAQDHNIIWNNLRQKNPYSTAAVTIEDDLIGRSEILEKLENKMTTLPTDSCIIYGQKRIGKTSLAKVALNRIQQSQDIVCIYLDVGTLAQTDPGKAIDKLTELLAQDLQAEIPLATQNKIKTDGSLAPLIELLREISKSRIRIILAIDEFDDLPTPLLSRTDISKTFFHALRGISNMDGIGLVLIGGERMNLIINGPPSIFLNKFVSFHLDRLDRETHWSDFENLVSKPAEDLDYSEKSYALIYEYTGGNPYYTKLLCDKILDRASKQKDSFVDEREVHYALEELIRDIESSSFAHYWEDYILEEEPKQEVSLIRRQCLLAFGRASDTNYRAPLEYIHREMTLFETDTVNIEDVFKEFVQRGILKRYDQTLEPCIKLFGHWIANGGQEKMIVSKSETSYVKSAMAEREALRVTFEEGENLVNNWDNYKGVSITVERVLSYLRQFDTPQDQRIVFKILRNLCFLGGSEENKLWGTAFQQLQDALRKRDTTRQRKQIRISHFGNIGKSSLAMARSFASANKFPRDKSGILKPNQIGDALKDGVSDIVICDDFVGTGDTLLNDLDQFKEYVMPEQQVHVFILSGMADGIDKVTNKAYELYGRDRINIRCLHELSSKATIFDMQSNVFGSEEEAERARRLLYDVGSRLLPKAPLGYGDCCSLITFSRTIPNNAPPILWKEATGDFKFQPLFPRL